MVKEEHLIPTPPKRAQKLTQSYLSIQFDFKLVSHMDKTVDLSYIMIHRDQGFSQTKVRTRD